MAGRDYNESSDIDTGPERDDVTGEVLYDDDEGDLDALDEDDYTAEEAKARYQELLDRAKAHGGTPRGTVLKGKLS